MDLNQFGSRMKELGAIVERGGAKLVQKTALVADQTVVIATPVDEGRARANWQVQTGTAPEGVIEAYDTGKGGSTGAENARAAIEQGQEAISRARPGEEIHITNNLPYIGRLNDGHSAQAPAGFVEQAVKTAVDSIRKSSILDEGKQ